LTDQGKLCKLDLKLSIKASSASEIFANVISLNISKDSSFKIPYHPLHNQKGHHYANIELHQGFSFVFIID